MNGADLPSACRKVAAAAAALGLEISIETRRESTRTAAEAAAAAGCEVSQIVKSLVFRHGETGEAMLFLVAGDNRLNEKHVAAALGHPIERPDAAFVRERTGFAIGGVPPFGHARNLPVWIDKTLLFHDLIFAAAGTPNSIFSVSPRNLARAIAARPIAVA